MKRWSLRLGIAVVIGLAVWWTAVGLRKQTLILLDGQSIIVDNIWYDGNRIFYRRGDRVAWVAVTEIREVVPGSWTNPSCYRSLLSAHFRGTLEWLHAAAGPGSAPAAVLRRLAGRIGALLPEIAGALIFGLLAIIGIRRIRRFFVKKTTPGVKLKSGHGGHLPQLAGSVEVAALFLDLYREAVGAPADAPVKIETIKESGPDCRGVYELKVEDDGGWRSRRITIAAIGEKSGSKSQCFYVIFDTHMVVKIPPVPISDFEDYIERIQAELKIRRKLAPKECVIPNISVILKKVHTFPEAAGLSDQHLEARYIRWLLQVPANQRFLKIGGSFVFFMDLAKSYFLSHVVRDFHRIEDLIAVEVQADADILTDLGQFETKYGRSGSALWPDLHQAYTAFQKKIGAAVPHSGKAAALSEWQTKNLFLNRMAGRQTAAAPPGRSGPPSAGHETFLAGFGAAHAATGHRYQQLLRAYTGQRLFDRSQPLMGAMITNLLSLLDWLGEHQVAMRDLKPDNLLAVGNPSEYPHFLSSARNYTIGLIDLETAVDYDRGSHASFQQPRLGGTPFYATPSHFFPNRLLEEVHDDLALVFHMQDWYAVIAIIYEVVTHRKLFGRTAREFPELMNTVRQALAKKADLQPDYVQFVHRFRECAAAEFQRNLELNAPRLEGIVAALPASIQRRLLDHNRAKQAAAEDRITQALNANPAFSKGKNRGLLEKNSAQDLERICATYAGRENAREQVCRLNGLIGLKREAENLAGISKTLQGSFPKVTVIKLLQLLFDVVYTQMPAGVTPAVPVEVFREARLADKAAAPPAGTVWMDETGEDHAQPEQGLGYSVTLAI